MTHAPLPPGGYSKLTHEFQKVILHFLDDAPINCLAKIKEKEYAFGVFIQYSNGLEEMIPFERISNIEFAS